jgi:hypothetical protein
MTIARRSSRMFKGALIWRSSTQPHRVAPQMTKPIAVSADMRVRLPQPTVSGSPSR